jgi:hypothetical protein
MPVIPLTNLHTQPSVTKARRKNGALFSLPHYYQVST